jgi:cell wall-associated NlpC family hydrolase
MEIRTIILVTPLLLFPGLLAAEDLAPPQEADPSLIPAHKKGLWNAGEELMMHALAFVGVHYKRGGENPLTGVDCSGFVQHVFKEAAGIVLPHNAYSLSLEGKAVSLNELHPGDLIFFNTVRRNSFSHVGLYLGDNRFIHAPRKGQQVQISRLDNAYWAKRFRGARRIIEPVFPQ